MQQQKGATVLQRRTYWVQKLWLHSMMGNGSGKGKEWKDDRTVECDKKRDTYFQYHPA